MKHLTSGSSLHQRTLKSSKIRNSTPSSNKRLHIHVQNFLCMLLRNLQPMIFWNSNASSLKKTLINFHCLTKLYVLVDIQVSFSLSFYFKRFVYFRSSDGKRWSCFKCMIIHQKHPNVLQYKESKFLENVNLYRINYNLHLIQQIST